MVAERFFASVPRALTARECKRKIHQTISANTLRETKWQK